MMSDLISKQAAIDTLNVGAELLRRVLDETDIVGAERAKYEWGLGLIESYISDIEELPSAQPEQRWIPCDKDEPDEDMECWVTGKTTYALYRGNFTKRYGERRDKGFITSGGFMWWNTALAWMPIYEPEPYSSEGDNHEG